MACCAAAAAPLARAEVSPVPPGSTAGLAPGATPPAVPVVTPKPATSPTLPRPVAISAAIKTATSLDTVQEAQVRQYIKTSFTRLLSNDASAVDTARADLVAGVGSPAPKTPCSAPYLNVYVDEFVKQARPIIDQATLPKRLNLAIVISRVSYDINAQGNPVPLQPFYGFIMAALNDKSEAIALWGMKAATQAIAAAPGLPTKPMLAAIVPSVQAHGFNGPVTEEAYRALNYPNSPEAIKATMDLYKLRVAAYANGVPPDPSVDRLATSYLTSGGSGMWAKLSKPDQDQVMGGLICNNLDGAMTAILKPDVTPELVAQLRTVCKDDGRAVYVATMNTAQSDLNLLANKLGNISDNATPQEVAAHVKPVVDGLRQAYPLTGGAVGATGNAAVAKP